MSEIEEGDQVVTPSILGGKVGEVVDTTEWVGEKHCSVHDGDKRNDNIPVDELVKVDHPIRVRVSRECYAESLVALAEECGFDTGKFKSYPDILTLMQKERELWAGDPTDNHDYDLTYRDDLPQIEAWLEYHSESEYDECDTWGEGIPKKKHSVGSLNYDCTDESDDTMSVGDDDERWIQNDTDESEEYDEPPPPEDGVDAEFVKNILWELCDITNRRSVGEYGEIIDSIVDRFRELESELQDCWENQQEYKNDVAELQEQIQDVRESKETLENIKEFHKNKHDSYKDSFVREYKKNRRLRERIEEASEKAEDVKDRLMVNELYGYADHVRVLLEILSDDSDEGDVCDGN